MERGAHRLKVLLVELHQLHYLIAQPLTLYDLPGGDGLTQGGERPHSSLHRPVDHYFSLSYRPMGVDFLGAEYLDDMVGGDEVKVILKR